MRPGRRRKLVTDLEQALLSIAKQAYREPREAADRLLSLGVPRAALWPAFGVIVLLSVVAGGISDIFAPPPPELAIPYPSMVILIAVVFLSFAAAVWKVGQAMGGKGSFEEAFLVSIFFQVVLLPVQIAQLVLSLIIPPLAVLIGIGILIFGVWVNANFIDALHGYASFGRSLAVLVLSSLVAAVGLLVAVSVLGLSIGGPV